MRLSFTAFLLVCGTIAFAQSPTPTSSPEASPTSTRQSDLIWRCELPGGIYEVMVRAMVSVSSHQYIVDGIARVTEVNIDTQGNSAVRFYYIEPNTPKIPLGVGQATVERLSDLAKEAAQRTDKDEIWKRVIKAYPATTHTHTVEYRVASEEQLRTIFTSAQTAFESGTGATLRITE